MRIITINLNGIRAAAKKGLFAWLQQENADVICMQELKAQDDVLQDASMQLAGYHAYFHCAEKKGYSGVGIYSRHQPKKIIKGLGWDIADQEGRYLAVNLGGIWIASLYLPSGTSGELRQTVKYDFLKRFANYLQNEIQGEHIICGDFNIAHKQIDLKNWRSNQRNSGFLPDERAWMDKLLGEMQFVDAFREVNQEAEQYTWWSSRSRVAWENNVGWRIDYQIITPGLKPTIKSAKIYKEQRFSDHAPVVMEYDIVL